MANGIAKGVWKIALKRKAHYSFSKAKTVETKLDVFYKHMVLTAIYFCIETYVADIVSSPVIFNSLKTNAHAHGGVTIGPGDIIICYGINSLVSKAFALEVSSGYHHLPWKPAQDIILRSGSQALARESSMRHHQMLRKTTFTAEASSGHHQRLWTSFAIGVSMSFPSQFRTSSFIMEGTHLVTKAFALVSAQDITNLPKRAKIS